MKIVIGKKYWTFKNNYSCDIKLCDLIKEETVLSYEGVWGFKTKKYKLSNIDFNVPEYLIFKSKYDAIQYAKNITLKEIGQIIVDKFISVDVTYDKCFNGDTIVYLRDQVEYDIENMIEKFKILDENE